MTPCRYLADTFLGQLFWRALGHRWQYRFTEAYVVRTCEKCGTPQYARRPTDPYAERFNWMPGDPARPTTASR